MQIWYFLNYVELSYSEMTFICHSINSESSALPHVFHIDIIDEFAEKGPKKGYSG